MPEIGNTYEVAFERPKSMYAQFDRKEDLQHTTHYCAGCGHGQVHKLLAAAIDELGIQDRTVLTSPVGCSVFAYYYFDVGNVQAAHGRAPAVATAIERSRPGATVISYQGDGDLSAIGSAEILHAANRGENITVIFVNNAIYSMTGGQMAPTTLVGQRSTTSPGGRNPATEGYPLRMSELLATLEAPVYIERVGLGDNRQIAQARRAIKRAVENTTKRLGFSMVEVLAPCPTIWKMSPVEAQRWVKDVMEKSYPLGVMRDRVKDAEPKPEPMVAPGLAEIPGLLGIEAAVPGEASRSGHRRRGKAVHLGVRVAGFGGQGVLLLGEVLAEAGLEAGLEVSWLPSYGPEMRSGTSNCHVRLASEPIDTPLVTMPEILVAMNEPSLRKFDASVKAGGWVIYNGEEFPAELMREDVHVLAREFTREAQALGDPRVANMVMLGALLELAGVVKAEAIHKALTKLVKSPKWVELDERALARGRVMAREEREQVSRGCGVMVG